MKLNVQLGARQEPPSWAEMRFGVIRPFAFLWTLFCRKLLKKPRKNGAISIRETKDGSSPYARFQNISVKRIGQIDDRFEIFWKQYLDKNRGIVSSRDAETLSWIFNDELKDGRYALLGAGDNGKLLGYMVMRPMSGSHRRWQIADMIALRNDAKILHLLLKGAKCFLRSDTDAITLESTGFPDFVQPLLSRHLPHILKTGHNRFEWITDNPEIVEGIEKNGNQPQSWFYGPFDGDYCM